jgi:hypothetical protein
MDYLAHLMFESELPQAMATLTSEIQTNCSIGKTVVINGWTPNDTSYVFDADSVSIHREIYKEIDWQGIHSITFFLFN